jgi:hypothetical protein
MSIVLLSQTAAALAVATLAAGPPSFDPPEPTVRIEVFARIGEDQAYESGLPELTSEPQAKILVVPPRHGSYRESGTHIVRYEPQEGYFGRDRMVFEVEVAGEWLTVEYQIEVLPRYFPLVGRWLGGSAYHAGYYDTQARDLTMCGAVGADGGLSCWSQDLGALRVPAGGIPVVLPTGEASSERLGIFSMATGRMYELPLRDGAFVLGTIRAYPDVIDAFPVVGNWNGFGQSLAFVDREGGIVSYSGEQVKETWPKVLGVPVGDQLTWPVRFPLGGQDGVALGEPASNFFPWQTQDFDSGSQWFGWGPEGPRPDIRRPIHWPGGVAAIGMGGDSVLFVLIEEGGALRLAGYRFSDGKPSTIPITFPNDPPPAPEWD